MVFASAREALDVLGRLRAQRIAVHMVDIGADVTTGEVGRVVVTVPTAIAAAERDRTPEPVVEVQSEPAMRYRGDAAVPVLAAGDSGRLRCPGAREML